MNMHGHACNMQWYGYIQCNVRELGMYMQCSMHGHACNMYIQHAWTWTCMCWLHVNVFICRSLSSWLQAKGEELAAADMVRGVPEEVRNQLEEVEVCAYL